MANLSGKYDDSNGNSNSSSNSKKDSPLLTEEYKRYHRQYAQKYSRVAILMQVGGFFELYAKEDEPDIYNVVTEICSLINCGLTIKDPRANNKVLMGGFPLRSLDKNIVRLVENDFTVVVIEHAGDAVPNGSKRLHRQVTRVVSKGTIGDSGRLRNNVMSIYFRKFQKNLYAFGIAVVDTAVSNNVVVHEIQSDPQDKGLALDTAIRFVAQYEPVECVFTTKWGENAQDVIRHLGFGCNVFIRDVQMIDQDIMESVRKHVYTDASAYSLAMLHTFLRDHRGVSTPFDATSVKIVPYCPDQHLDLCSTAVKQLDIYSLFNRREFNVTCTSMGRRLLLDRMLNPTKDIAELNRRYDAISDMNEERATFLKTVLSKFPDLSRLHQKLSVGCLTWGQFRTLHDTFVRAKSVLPANDAEKISQFIGEYCSSLALDARDGDGDGGDGDGERNDNDMTKDEKSDDGDDRNGESDITDSKFTNLHVPNIFRKQVHPDLDELNQKITASKDYIQLFVEKALFLTPKCTGFKIKENAGLITTVLRAENLKKNIPQCQVIKMHGSAIVYTPQLREHLTLYSELLEQMTNLVEKYFRAFQRSLYRKWESVLHHVVDCISELDVQQASFAMSKRFRLTRPVITSERKLHIRGLRHLLIELYNSGVRYIPNDCLLQQSLVGMLLYGMNSCGKTSLLKAVGLAVVLAQAGLFVPATSMEFSPFSRIMTRIAGTDNMERSQSSYIVELEELLSIIQRANTETLVLGDEMCRGTEIESANAMVHTVIKWLVEKGTFFIAATHLHDIAERIVESPSLKSCISIFHMKVTIDDQEEVTYERSLSPGPGPRLYGLEIAKAMHFPSTFLKEAMKERATDRQERTISTSTNIASERIPVKSRYNAKKILVKCECCGYRPTTSRCMPLDTHHIEFQCNADSDGFHGTQKKNALHNLISLCKECHIKVHKQELVVNSLQTLKGTKYVVKPSANTVSCEQTVF